MCSSKQTSQNLQYYRSDVKTMDHQFVPVGQHRQFKGLSRAPILFFGFILMDLLLIRDFISVTQEFHRHRRYHVR